MILLVLKYPAFLHDLKISRNPLLSQSRFLSQTILHSSAINKAFFPLTLV